MRYNYFCNNQKCSQYKKYFEVVQSIKEPRLTTCEHCKTDNLEKKLETPAFKVGGIGAYDSGFKK